jgi:hypothetical protein
MAQSAGPRSFLATIVGYVLVALIAWVVLGWVLGTFFWLIRTIIIVVLIGGLLMLYVSLKTPKD